MNVKYSSATTLFVYLIAANAYASECAPGEYAYYPSNRPPNYYGNGQTGSFRCAIAGKGNVTPEEAEAREALIPKSHNNRYFVRFGLNAASESLSSVKNESLVNTNAASGIVSNRSTKVASNEVELAFGYTWKSFSMDIEWLALRKIGYEAALNGTAPAITYTSTLSGDAYLGNIYLNFEDLYNFKFYFVTSIGFTKHKTETRVNASAPSVSNRWGPTLGGGVGARFNVVSKLYADMAARYLWMSNTVKMEDSDGTSYATLKGTRTWTGVSVRLMWML